MTIIWKKSMGVGSPVIDNEHKHLFSLVNCVLLAIKVGESETIELFIDQLIEYTHEHFANEEKLQIAIRYPGYSENKVQHQKILANLQEVKEKLQLINLQQQVDNAEKEPVEEQLPDGSIALSVNSAEIKDPPEKLIEELAMLVRHWILDHVLVIDRKMQNYLAKLPQNKKQP